MTPWITRHVICPLHERLLGRSTLRYFRELAWSQWLAPNDLRELQRRKLEALLRHANLNIPFYRRRFGEVEAESAGEDPLKTLGLLPLLSKEEIRQASDEMLWHDSPGGLFRNHTGGSTGEPLVFYLDRRRQGYDQAARLRCQQWFGVHLGDRELYLWGSPIEFSRTDRIKRMRDSLFNHRLLNAFDMSPGRLDEYLKEWDRFRPVSLFGYPSSIALFVEHALSHGHSLDTSRLRAVFVTGEVCHAHDRSAIASYFDVPVANGYGSREAGFIAHECPQGNMHITAENVIVEIVRDGQAVSVGLTGEIVVTHLDAYAMPFIRYRTGDVGRLKPGRCTCGRGLPMIDIVLGRTTDFLYLPDGNVKHALSIIYPLREMKGVRRFRVTQQRDYAVTVEVVCDDRAERVTKEAVARRVRPVVGDQVPLHVKLVADIPASPSGKYRYVQSHVQPTSQRLKEESTAGVQDCASR